MELKHYSNKPKTRTSIYFTEAEVIEALKCHAEKRGFTFKEDVELVVWESQRHSPHPQLTKLEAYVDGVVPAITKEPE